MFSPWLKKVFGDTKFFAAAITRVQAALGFRITPQLSSQRDRVFRFIRSVAVSSTISND
jgi:hypothetical protein